MATVMQYTQSVLIKQYNKWKECTANSSGKKHCMIKIFKSTQPHTDVQIMNDALI